MREQRVSLRFPIQGIKTCIQNFSGRPEHRSVDSCVVCLLSHGVEGAVYGVDGQLLQVLMVRDLLLYAAGGGNVCDLTSCVPFQLDWVFEAFDNAHCPLLQNKPKMFFIQACRGGEC